MITSKDRKDTDLFIKYPELEGFIDKKEFEILLFKQKSTIYKMITPRNKIYYLFFLLCERPKLVDDKFFTMDDFYNVLELGPKGLKNIPKSVYDEPEFIDKLLNLTAPSWYDYLPRFLASDQRFKLKCGLIVSKNAGEKKKDDESQFDKDGYNIDWMDKDGNIRKYFELSGDTKIESKSDYYKIYKAYVTERLSVPAFCKLYGITPESGFIKFLEKVEPASYEDRKIINDIKNKKDIALNEEARNYIDKILNNEMSLVDFFNSNEINFNANKIDIYYKNMNEEEKKEFSKLLVLYLEENAVSNGKNYIYISENYMKFINSNMVLHHHIIKHYIYLLNDKELIKKAINQRELIVKITPFSTRQNLYCKNITGDGTVYEVNDDVIDQAIVYLQDSGYYVSENAMSVLCDKIARGKFSYKERTEEKKKEMIEDIIEMVDMQRSIEEYIAYRKQKYIEKRR